MEMTEHSAHSPPNTQKYMYTPTYILEHYQEVSKETKQNMIKYLRDWLRGEGAKFRSESTNLKVYKDEVDTHLRKRYKLMLDLADEQTTFEEFQEIVEK